MTVSSLSSGEDCQVGAEIGGGGGLWCRDEGRGRRRGRNHKEHDGILARKALASPGKQYIYEHRYSIT